MRLPHAADLPLPRLPERAGRRARPDGRGAGRRAGDHRAGRARHDSDRDRDRAAARHRRADPAALRARRCGTASPCSTRRAPSMPTTAAKSTSSWSISAQEPFTVERGDAHCTTGHRGYTASYDLRGCQTWMKQHAGSGVLVLRARDGGNEPATTSSCNRYRLRLSWLSSRNPDVVMPAFAAQRHPGHRRRHRHRAACARAAGGSEGAGDAPPPAAAASRAGAAGAGAARHPPGHSRAARRLRACARTAPHHRRRYPARRRHGR